MDHAQPERRQEHGWADRAWDSIIELARSNSVNLAAMRDEVAELRRKQEQHAIENARDSASLLADMKVIKWLVYGGVGVAGASLGAALFNLILRK